MAYDRELRKGYIELCRSFAPDTMVTLATHQLWTLERMTKLVGAFAARMDDYALGTRWFKEPRFRRANGMFFIEHVGSNIHAHGLVRFPYGDTHSHLLIGERVWKALCPSGTIKVDPMYRFGRAAVYCTKEMKRQDFCPEQVLLLEQFMSPHSLSEQRQPR